MRDPRFNDEQRAEIAKEIRCAMECMFNTGLPQQVWYDTTENFAYVTTFAKGETYSEIEAPYFERSILILRIKAYDLKDIYEGRETDVDWNNPEYWRTEEYCRLEWKYLHDKNEFDPEAMIDIAYTAKKLLETEK